MDCAPVVISIYYTLQYAMWIRNTGQQISDPDMVVWRLTQGYINQVSYYDISILYILGFPVLKSTVDLKRREFLNGRNRHTNIRQQPTIEIGLNLAHFN